VKFPHIQQLGAVTIEGAGRFIVFMVHGEVAEIAMRDWLLYGELHITNAQGFTVLDPKGITYKPTGNERPVNTDHRGCTTCPVDYAHEPTPRHRLDRRRVLE